VEQSFPELDNHLINHLQFSTSKIKNSFIAAYVKMEIPHWSGLDFSMMKNRRLLRRAQLALGVASIILLLPLPFLGRAWTVSMVRVLNPFSEMAPVSLTQIISVSPGDAVVIQGSDVTFSCKVEGKSGHEVLFDVRPADGELKTYNLGSLKGEGEETFSHTLLKVTTVTKYRFRAGDAYVPDWKKITLRPPLAFNALSLKVAPPSYMGLKAKKYDAQATTIDIPYGSRVSMNAECNTELRSLSLSGAGSPVSLDIDQGKKNGSFDIIVTNGAALTLAAIDANGDQAETSLGFNLLWDRPPALTIKYPQKPVHLPAGSAPTIDFSVSDDFGLGDITIEQVSGAGDSDEPPRVLKTYSRAENKGKELSYLWKGNIRKASDSGNLVLRVVAKDNCSGAGNVSVSPSLIFEYDDASDSAKQRKEDAKKSAAGLLRCLLRKGALVRWERWCHQSRNSMSTRCMRLFPCCAQCHL
jgi:hypothetical protein